MHGIGVVLDQQRGGSVVRVVRQFHSRRIGGMDGLGIVALIVRVILYGRLGIVGQLNAQRLDHAMIVQFFDPLSTQTGGESPGVEARDE